MNFRLSNQIIPFPAKEGHLKKITFRPFASAKFEGMDALRACRERRAEACSTKCRNLTPRRDPPPYLSPAQSPASSHPYKAPGSWLQPLSRPTGGGHWSSGHDPRERLGSKLGVMEERGVYKPCSVPERPLFSGLSHLSQPSGPCVLSPLLSGPLFPATSQPFPRLGGRAPKASLAWLAGFALPYQLPAQTRAPPAPHIHTAAGRGGREGGARMDPRQ